MIQFIYHFIVVVVTADQVLIFDWIASSTHFSCAFCGSMRLHGHTTSTIVLTQSTLFVFRCKMVWKMFCFCIFRWFQSSLTYHDSCGPQWRLRSYSSQASEGYKLKAECLFLICSELVFSLYCNFWHIFRSSEKVT